jgi:hypothetical protein
MMTTAATLLDHILTPIGLIRRPRFVRGGGRVAKARTEMKSKWGAPGCLLALFLLVLVGIVLAGVLPWDG